MAARKKVLKLSNEWRERIRSGMIMYRLEQAALGKLEIPSNQLKAAEILLRKTIPDLAKTEITGKDNGPQEHVFRWKDSA